MKNKIIGVMACMIIFLTILPLTVAANQPPETPDAPDGPTGGLVEEEYTFTANTTDPDNDDIAYMFDWGDGTYSDELTDFVPSGTVVNASHSWTEPGDYYITVTATDIYGSDSDWSESLQVTIELGILGDVSNDGFVNYSDDINPFVIAIGSEGDPLVFYAQVPGGNWFAADCNKDGEVNMSDILPFDLIIDLAEASSPPETPDTPDGPTEGAVGEELTFTTTTSDPDGDRVYYKWDWGNEFSDWIGFYSSGATVEASHTWIEPGTYEIQVKAIDIYKKESEWSSVLNVAIIDQSLELQLAITAPASIIEGVSFDGIVTANGIAIENATVEFLVEYYYTDVNGIVNLTAPLVDANTNYIITTNKEGYQSDTATITVLNQKEDKEEGWVYGVVYSDSVESIKETSVCAILSDVGTTSKCTFTDVDGNYVISVPVGTYTIEAGKEGYETSTKLNIVVKKNVAIEVTFILQKIVDYKPEPSGDENKDFIDAAIDLGISAEKVGGEMDLTLTDEKYIITLYKEELNVEVVSIEEGDFSFTINAVGIPGTILVIRIIGQKDFADISVEYDNEIIEEVTFAEIFSSTDHDSKATYTTVLTRDENITLYCLIYIPKFSEHEINIFYTLIEIVEPMGVITVVIFYIIVCVFVGIVFSSPKFIRVIRRIYFQK